MDIRLFKKGAVTGANITEEYPICKLSNEIQPSKHLPEIFRCRN